MPFKTITTDLNNSESKIGIINKSFADLKNALYIKNTNGLINNGISGLINAFSPVITNKDIENIKKYNYLVK